MFQSTPQWGDAEAADFHLHHYYSKKEKKVKLKKKKQTQKESAFSVVQIYSMIFQSTLPLKGTNAEAADFHLQLYYNKKVRKVKSIFIKKNRPQKVVCFPQRK